MTSDDIRAMVAAALRHADMPDAPVNRETKR
jgi:hypothetical protein